MTKYILAGGTSELGNRVVRELALRIKPENITCLVRATSNVKFLKSLGISVMVGDVTESETFRGLLNNSSIYIDMTHPKYYDESIDIVKLAGVRRAFFVTTTGIFSKYNHCSDIYKIGEAKIKSSGIDYTILRPSLIYGTDRDRNMTKLLRTLFKYPVFPIFGDGQGLMQPVYVQDLAIGIVTAILKPEITNGKEYNLCGPTAIPYISILELACKALGKHVKFIYIPHKLAVVLAGFGERIPGFPIKKEQVLRLQEDKKFDISAAVADLGYSPREFSVGIKEEVSLLRSKGLL